MMVKRGEQGSEAEWWPAEAQETEEEAEEEVEEEVEEEGLALNPLRCLTRRRSPSPSLALARAKRRGGGDAGYCTRVLVFFSPFLTLLLSSSPLHFTLTLSHSLSIVHTYTLSPNGDDPYPCHRPSIQVSSCDRCVAHAGVNGQQE